MKLPASLGLCSSWIVLGALSACASGPQPAVVTPAASVTAGGLSAAPVAASGAASGVAAAVARPAVAPAPGQPPAFDTVIKEATRKEGAFVLWVQKDGKVWIELAEGDFDVPLFLSPKLATGIGEGGVFGGLMSNTRADVGRPQLVAFRRVHQQVQLVARNTRFVAEPGTPQARALKSAFSDSLIGSAPLASQPHPQRKSVLVEVNALLTGDWLGLGPQLQRAFRQGYAFDARNSALQQVRSKPDVAVFELVAHYATSSLSPPQPGASASAPAPRTPAMLADPRSLFITIHYSLSRLPAQPMATRAADPRVGHFNTVVSDFSDDLARSPKRRWINRWRLEKKDPAAPLSEPVKPIVYWIDRTVPLKYRDSITAGILEWNRAFEAIGFKDAIVVKQQPDDADFDTLDMGVNSVRWMSNADPGFGAIGPIHTDPRSGEILDADIALESLSSRGMRAVRSQVLGGAAGASADGLSADWLELLQASDALREHGLTEAHASEACAVLAAAGEQLGYALDVLAARGQLDPASPEAEQFVQAYMKDVTMHEVGHTLGLRHNFRASRVYGPHLVAEPAFGRAHALSGSVMEYLPINLPRPGEPAPVPFQSTLGPYDFWAIEYAYKPLTGDAASQAQALQALAARSAEPALAFATDEDNLLGIDPEGLSFDLGDDPIAFASTRAAIARDLLQRLDQRTLDPTQDYAVLRRVVRYALRDLGRATGIVTRQIAGVRTLRDFPGTGRDPLQPVPAAAQRAALDWLAENILNARGLALPAGLQRKLAPDFLERGDALNAADDSGSETDFSPEQQVLDLQRALLAQLMSDGVAQRLLDAVTKAAPGEAAPLRLAELMSRLNATLWHDLPGRTRGQRALQRDHATRLAQLLLRPATAGRAEARSLWRQQARALLARLQVADRPGLSDEARAHVQDCVELLREALQAKVVRPGV